jgi:putative membrane protein
MTKLTIVSLSLAAAFGLSAQAQNQYQGQSQTTQSSSQDTQFIQQASEDNIAGMELGKLGAQSQNSQIQQLGKHMESAHRSANKQLQSIAQNQGFSVSQRLSSPTRQEIQKLQQLSGSQFDQQFAQVALKDHARAADLFQREVQQGQNPQLKQYAQSMLPGVQRRLQMSQTAAKDVGVSSSTIAGILNQYPNAAVGGAQTPGGQGQGAGSSQSGQDQMQQPQYPK